MAYSTSFPQQLNYSQGAIPVKLVPMQDSETGDENIEPPFVRVRSGNTAYMYLDTSPETQKNDNNTAEWIIGDAGPDTRSNLYARKFKRSACRFVEIMWATPNVNPRNNTIIFRHSANPALSITAVIPTYNYMRLFQSTPFMWTNSAGAGLPVPVFGPFPGILTSEVDLEDGILTKFAAAMTAAIHAAGFPGIDFTVVPSDGYRDLRLTNYQNTNCIFWRMAPTIGSFIFEGGSLFQKGQFLLGVTPIEPYIDVSNVANYYPVYQAGPVSFLYTRYVDICSRTLLDNTKLDTSGTNVPPNLIMRVYFRKEDQASGILWLPLFETAQWFNWRKDQVLSSVDLQLRDEFGDLVELPLPPNAAIGGGNNTWMNIVFLNEL